MNDNELAKKIGSRLKELRNQIGITQEEMSNASGVARSYISELESGKKLPRLSVLNTLLKTFNTDFQRFFDF